MKAWTLLAAPLLIAAAPAERDWGKTLREDAQALHDDIAANHPGPVNPADPGFAANNDAQLAIALEKARTAKTYAEYFFPLRIYVSSFNDGHMGFGALGATPNDVSWPGFATRYDGNGGFEVGTEEPGAVVPRGARLLSCDGMSANAYAAATIGRMWGRWKLESQHVRFGPLLFIDEGSGAIPRAKSCDFEVAGKRQTVPLAWRPLDIARVGPLMKSLGTSAPPAFAARTLANGVRWYSIPSFNGEPGSLAGKTLPGMIADMAKDRDSVLAAPAVVIDLRGNGGGSSDWSAQIANILWGGPAIKALLASADAAVNVDWRASPANLADIAKGYDERRGAPGFSPDADQWFRSVIAGLGTAIARGDALWRHVDFGAMPDAESAANKAIPAPVALKNPIFVLTDGRCASACLDAVDLMTALGAVQVGRTTSADTLYMDIRQRTLPSGLTSISVPMKVYSGRKRGSNEPAVPRHLYPGDIGDTGAVEAWIPTLPEMGRID